MTVQWNIDVAVGALTDSATEALQDAADYLLDESNRKAPIETGDLIRSGVARADGLEAAVGYSSIYAARQHEELTWRHDAGREAKYLENALVNHRDEIRDIIARKLGMQ